MQRVFLSVPADHRVKISGRILGCTGTQTVEAQRILVVLSLIIAVLAAGIELTEHQFPVEPLLCRVPVYRAAPSKVFYLHRMVQITGDKDLISVPLSGFINGIGQNLKHCVLAALQPIRAENNCGTKPNPVCALEHGNTLVAIGCFLLHVVPPCSFLLGIERQFNI